MRLFIPELGTKLNLTTDWTFRLFVLERRNQELGELFLGRRMRAAGAFLLHEFVTKDKKYDGPSWQLSKVAFYDVTLPAGTVLTVDRIYIRRGQDDFDSLTFRVSDHKVPWLMTERAGKPKMVKPRFWVKLVDANNIECEVVS